MVIVELGQALLDVVEVGRSELCWRQYMRLLSSRRRVKRGDALVTSKLVLGGVAGKVLRLILVGGSLEGVQGRVHLLIYSRVFSVLALIKECDG